MTSFKELVALFPGEDKDIITIHARGNDIWIYYGDGSTLNIEDPIQVQDIIVPTGKEKAFIDALRLVVPTASKSTYMSRKFLVSILETI